MCAEEFIDFTTFFTLSVLLLIFLIFLSFIFHLTMIVFSSLLVSKLLVDDFVSFFFFWLEIRNDT